jgi:hypothetical protein
MEVELEKFKKVKEEAEKFYKEIGEIYCPYLKEKVSFNAKGLDHVKFKEWDKARSLIEQYIRLKLLQLVPYVIKESHTLQEFDEKSRFERQKINSRWEQRLVKVKYYGFVAIIKGARIKIIVKEIEGGKRFFWSLIPFWKPRKDEFGNKIKKILHEGDLEIQ